MNKLYNYIKVKLSNCQMNPVYAHSLINILIYTSWAESHSTVDLMLDRQPMVPHINLLP